MKLFTLIIWLIFCGIAHAVTPLEQWREKISEVRVLAENDAPAAYIQAKALQQSLPTDANTTDQVAILNSLARIELHLALTDLALEHGSEAFELAKAHDDKVGQAEADLNLALGSVNAGRIDKMNEAVIHSMTILDGITNRPDLLAESMLRASMMYRRMDQLDDAIAIGVQALEVAKQSNHPLAMSYGLQGMAFVYDFGGRHREALDIYSQMRVQAIEARSKILEATAILGIGSMSFSLGNTVDGERLMREGVDLYRQTGSPFYISHALFRLSDQLRRVNRYEESLSLLDEIVQIQGTYNNRIGLWWGVKTRSEVYQVLGKIELANKDAKRSYQVAKEIGFSVYLNESARRMAGITAMTGDYKRAYQLVAEADEMQVKTSQEKINKRIVELAQRYENESKQRKIDELNRRNEQQTHEIVQRQWQQRSLITLLISSIAVTSLILFFTVRLRRSKEAIELLNATLEQRVLERTAELYRKKSYLRTLIDTLPMMAWLKDKRSRFIIANQGVAKTLGKSVDDLVGKTDLDFLPKDIAEVCRSEDAEVMATKQTKVFEEQVTTVNGEILWLEIFKTAVLDEDGSVLGTVGVARDISERKAMEEAREKALAEAVRLATLRSEFMARMSHELRTPLNGILGYTQLLLREEISSDTNQNRMLTVIEQSGEHLLHLINNILDFAKIEAGKQTLSFSNVRLSNFLHTLVNIIQIRIGHKPVVISCNIAFEAPDVVRVDEIRLRQVLLNLLSNALNHTEEGEISLNLKVLESNRLRFEVKDSGLGIEADKLETIFQPFEQAMNKPYNSGGTGLGLAISRELVRLMGSDIYVKSCVGEGSLFWFDLDVMVVLVSSASTESESEHLNFHPSFETEPTEEDNPTLVIPSSEEMKVLHHLALEGTMRGIIERANYLANLNPRYRPFTERLRVLAQSYQSKSILELVENYLEKE